MNELDKIFQSKLENHTTEYSEQSWDKIQSRLMKEKSKPKQLPWMWMSLAAVVAISTLYLWTTGDDSANASDLQTDTHIPVAANTNDHAITLSDSESDMAISDKEYNAQSESATESSSSEKYPTASQQIIINELGENENQSTSDVIKNKVSIDESASEQIANNESIINRAIKTKGTDNNINPIVELTTEIAPAQEKSIPNEILAVKTDLRNKINEVINIRPLRTIGVSSYTTLKSDEESVDIALSKSMMDDFRQDCPSFVTDRTGVYLDFYVSHELPFSSLKAKTQDMQPYANLRSNSEGPTYSFSAGARLTLMLPNGLGLKTGLNYSQVNEKFTHVDNESDMVTNVITVTTVDGMEVRDTNTIIIPGTRDIISTNKYRSFDIPILLSYEWDVRERTYMTVNGGAYLNLLFKESGKILSPSGDVADLTDTSGDKLAIFKNNIGLSLFGSVGLHYRMKGNIDLILEPNVRLLVKSATLDSYSIEHKWLTAGLITGMRYNF